MTAKFLIAHPDHFTLRAVEVALREQQHNARVANDGLDVIDQALDDHPDAIVLSPNLPGLNGLDVARALRALEPTQRIPILFLARDDNEAASVAHAGLPMVDWMTGPIDLARFVEQSSRLLDQHAQIPVGRVTDADRELSAISDPLTGLYERHYMLHRLAYEGARTVRYKTPLSCVLFGVDRFEGLATRVGQVLATGVLVGIANLFRRASRVSDVIGRAGADEFLVITPHTDEEGAQKFATRVLKLVRAHDFDLPAKDSKVTVSAGIAGTLGASLAESLTLMGRAEAALDQARSEGGDRLKVG